MKKLFVIFLLLLLAGCTAPKVELQEITNESIITEIPEVNIEQDTAPYYNFTEGETKTLLGSTITVIDIESGPKVDLIVDGEEVTIKDTKSEELSGDLSIFIQNIIYSYDEQNKLQKAVTLRVEQFDLAANEYLIQKGVRTNVGEKDIVLESSRSDSIEITVYDKGRNSGDFEEVKHGESLYIYGITVTNEKNYYKTSQYAIISVE